MKKKTLFSMIITLCLALTPMLLLTACDKEHVHTMEHHEAVAPTCEVGGTMEYWHCTECNKNYTAETDGKEIENISVGALGHDYKNYTYNAVDKIYTGVCTHDSSHTDVKPAGIEGWPYEVSSEADFEALGVKDATKTDTIYLKLTNDIALVNPMVIDRPVVVDLNEKTISYISSVESTMLTIGKTNRNEFKVVIKNGNLKLVGNWASEKRNLITCDYSSRVELSDIHGESNKYGIALWTDTQVSIKNSTITSRFMTIANNNTGDNTLKQSFTADDNCMFVASEDTTIFVGGYMTMNINNSTIIGKTGGVHILMGDIKITNSTITAGEQTPTTLKTITAELLKGQGTNPADGSAVMIRADLYYDETAKTNKLALDFTGTTITSSTGVTFSLYKCNDFDKKLAGVENKTTVMNQAEYVESALANLPNTKVFEYVNDEVKEVVKA